VAILAGVVVVIVSFAAVPLVSRIGRADEDGAASPSESVSAGDES
jgi:hypothetical protein